jgi:F-box/leucine-rich repeat protein 7
MQKMGITKKIDIGPNLRTTDYSEQFMNTIVSKMGTVFATPEEPIIKQDDPSDSLYYISQGDCTVDIIDEKRVNQKNVRLLTEGSHFGEIGVIYNCVRTASITSRNYNTMAILSRD